MTPTPVELVTSVCLGLGLSAACGFRVFLPLFVMGAAAHFGHIHLSGQFQWLSSIPALITFGAATLLEIAAYYIPWLDHFLDVLATPAAIIAGALITASIALPMNPGLHWTLALIAGGGLAGAVQASTVTARGVSLVGTGGLANPVIATGELAGSIVTSLLSILLPVLALALVLIGLGAVLLLIYKKRRSAPASR